MKQLTTATFFYSQGIFCRECYSTLKENNTENKKLFKPHRASIKAAIHSVRFFADKNNNYQLQKLPCG